MALESKQIRKTLAKDREHVVEAALALTEKAKTLQDAVSGTSAQLQQKAGEIGSKVSDLASEKVVPVTRTGFQQLLRRLPYYLGVLAIVILLISVRAVRRH